MAFQSNLKTMMAQFQIAVSASRVDRTQSLESPRTFTEGEYQQYLKDTSSFIPDWWESLDDLAQKRYQPFVEAVSTVAKNGNLIAGESLVMNLANRLGAGATMQTSKVGRPGERVIWVNRDFLDEMMTCGADPAEVAAGLLHEGGHIIQGVSRFGPFREWGPSKIYDPNNGNHTVRESMETYFQALPTSEQRRYTRFGPLAR